MTDQEVGELWAHTNGPAAFDYHKDDVQELIRKLVYERACTYAPEKGPSQRHINEAIEDFGIDPDTWKD